jgi:hypothetical protein
MSIATQIKHQLNMPGFVVQSYLEDLSDQDLLRRPVANANHIAWQLGHLIKSEHNLNNMVCPDSMPDLPAGFADQHSDEAATNDDSSAFCTKDEYLQAMETQRAGTLALLDKLSDDELEKPAPEQIQKFGATVGAVIAGQSSHWMMHAGQWVIVRRQLGKAANF